MTATDAAREMVQIAADAAVAKGGEDLVALDVSLPLPLVDAFLIVTGRSERNVAAIADEVEDKLLLAGHKRIRREGRQESRWICSTSATSSCTCSTSRSGSSTVSSGCGRTARSSRSS